MAICKRKSVTCVKLLVECMTLCIASSEQNVITLKITYAQHTAQLKFFKGENFHGFCAFVNNHQNFNLEIFVLRCISTL